MEIHRYQRIVKETVQLDVRFLLMRGGLVEEGEDLEVLEEKELELIVVIVGKQLVEVGEDMVVLEVGAVV